MSTPPLVGLRVLDLSKVLAGPLCAQYLGDTGAEVIKVETPEAGDETRQWPPFREVKGTHTGAVFLSANRNKRSLAIDLKSNAGCEVIHKLALTWDIVITSFGSGVSLKLRVDADTLRALNSRVVCCDTSGFGTVGPMPEGKGYDVIRQAFCGMLAVTGEADGPPVRSPFPPVDQATGLHALIGVLAALFKRARTDEGAVVEASLFDTATGLLGYYLQSFWERGTDPVRAGSGLESLCLYQAFETADAPLILGVANDDLWKSFCRVAGLDVFLNDSRFVTNAERVKHRAETVGLVQETMRKRVRTEWLELLDKAGVPNSPLHKLSELFNHSHIRESGMRFDYLHPLLGPLSGIAQPIRIDSERMPFRTPPLHGQHTSEILRKLNYTDEATARITEALHQPH